MGNLELQAGQFIQVFTDSSDSSNFYESKLISINKNFLEISMPFYNGSFVPLNTGFDLNLKTKTLQQDEFEFSSKIIGRNTTKQSLFISIPQDLLEEIEAETESKSSLCKFITVISGKGGTGKTSFIINYAIALSKKGKKVALVDADLGMANMDILLKITPIHTLADVIRGDKALEEVIVDAPGNVKLVPGGSGLQELSYLNPYQLERIFSGFEYLENNFDYVLIDTSSGLSKNINEFVFTSQETIIVTTPEPHAISDAFSILRVLIPKHKDLNLKLVVNRCESAEEGEAVFKRISGVVNNISGCRFTPLAFIPENALVGKCTKNQTPIYLAFPECDVSLSIESIADTELGIPQKPVVKNAVSASSGDEGLNNKNVSNPVNLVKKFKGLFAKGT